MKGFFMLFHQANISKTSMETCRGHNFPVLVRSQEPITSTHRPGISGIWKLATAHGNISWPVGLHPPHGSTRRLPEDSKASTIVKGFRPVSSIFHFQIHFIVLEAELTNVATSQQILKNGCDSWLHFSCTTPEHVALWSTPKHGHGESTKGSHLSYELAIPQLHRFSTCKTWSAIGILTKLQSLRFEKMRSFESFWSTF